MHHVWHRLDARAHALLVRSAAEGGFNMLRVRGRPPTHSALPAPCTFSQCAARLRAPCGAQVWGGGVFLPGAFYEACDELGLLVYHDMQYAQSGHAPQATATQEAELRHQARRLDYSYHENSKLNNDYITLAITVSADTPPREPPVHRRLGRLQRVPRADGHAHRDLRHVRDARRRLGGRLPRGV